MANTDQQTIPYARFKEVNEKRAAAESALAALQAKYDADTATLAARLEAASNPPAGNDPDGNDAGDSDLQARYDALQAEHEALQGQVRQFEREQAVRRVADEYGIPGPVAERLRGDTEAELRADAKALLQTMPRQPAPDINASTKGTPQPKLSLGLMSQPSFYQANRDAIFGTVKSGARFTE